MSPLDAIQPPRQQKKSRRRKTSPPAKKTKIDKSTSLSKQQKELLIWLIAGVITIFILMAWLAISPGDQTTKSSPSSLFSKIDQRLTNIWQKIQTDILKIKSELNNINNNVNQNNVNQEEAEIKKLEEQVFPQFNEPARQ